MKKISVQLTRPQFDALCEAVGFGQAGTTDDLTAGQYRALCNAWAAMVKAWEKFSGENSSDRPNQK